MNKYRKLELEKRVNTKKEDYKYFVGTTLKNPLEYKASEKIVFKIRVKYMDDYLPIPFVWYKLIGDDKQQSEGYIKCAEDGWFYIETSVKVSGFVYLQAKACDENKQIIEGIAVYNGSAGADIENITCGTKTPEDYCAFWEGLKAEVEATEPEILYCERAKKEVPDFETYEMRIKSPRNEYASVSVAYPKNAEKGSLGLAMFFQGYGVGFTEPKPIQGYLTVYVNAHCMPNAQSPEFYSELREGRLKGYGYDAEENSDPQTTYWARMLLRDLQALRYFKDNELLNKKDYIFSGSSQGGMQAMNMAAHFERASAVILNVPWLADICGSETFGRRVNSMPKGVGVAYFDTAVAAQFLKCPAYIISGLGDGCCHSATQMALFNALKSQKYIEFYQNKVHSFTIPWDNLKYTLGDQTLSGQYSEFTADFYNMN